MPDINRIDAAMTRNTIPPGQLTLYKMLRATSGYVGREDLIAGMKRAPGRDLNGVMGALGKRVSHTSGLEIPPDTEPTSLLLKKRTGDDGYMEYQLQPEARRLIEDNDQIDYLLDLPVEELRENGHKVRRTYG